MCVCVRSVAAEAGSCDVSNGDEGDAAVTSSLIYEDDQVAITQPLTRHN